MSVRSRHDFEEVLALESSGNLALFSESRSGHVDVLVAPGNLAQCQNLLKSRDLKFSVQVEDVGSVVSMERKKLLNAAPPPQGQMSYKNYQRLSVLHEHLDSLETSYPWKAKTFIVGTSHEGRNIKGIRITSNVTEGTDKPAIWLDGGIHAREWVSPATVMYIIDALLGEVEQDKAEKMSELLEMFQFYISPSINPDGYEYSHDHDRLWRKTRAMSGCKDNMMNWFGGCFYHVCYGVDPNRNWDVDFGRVNAGKDPCSQTYPGKKPFDQKNTKAVSDYLGTLQDNLVLYVTYHSYSQLFLTPLGYNETAPINAEYYKGVGDAVVGAIFARNGAKYINQQSAALYAASGDSADWVHDKLGVTDTYTIELRPDENSPIGFDLPAEQILPTAQENVDGLIALIDNMELSQLKAEDDADFF